LNTKLLFTSKARLVCLKWQWCW